MSVRRLILWGSALPCATVGLALSCASAQAAVAPHYVCQIAGTASSAQCGGAGSKTPAGSVGTPGALAVNGSGDVYVGDRENDVVDEFSSTGTYICQIAGTASSAQCGGAGSKTPAGSLRPGAVAVNGSGDIYVGDIENQVVDEFSPTGTYLTQFNGSATPAGSFYPRALAVNGSGDVYVGDHEHEVVDEFSSTGTYLTQFNGSATPAGSFEPAALAVSGSGDVYLGDTGHGVVDEFSPTGTYLTQFNGGATPAGSFSPYAVAADGSGDVYVGDGTGAVVDEFSSTGTYLTQFNGSATPAGSFNPAALAVNGSGRVYVGDTERGLVDEYALANKYLLTVEKEGTGAAEGKVTSTPTGIECGATCSGEFESGETVTLEAKGEGATFEGWSGAGCSGTGTCEVTMTEAKTVKAEFTEAVLSDFPVNVEVTGHGEVNGEGIVGCTETGGTCTKEAKETKKVTLTAKEASGWKFTKWSLTGGAACEQGTPDTSLTCTFTMPKAEVKVGAEFDETHAFPLTVVVTGEGEVTSSPAGIIACGPLGGTECSHPFEGEVTLTATPKAGSGYVFVGWLGCKKVLASTCEVDVTGETEVTAVFLKEGKVGEEGKAGERGSEGKEGPGGETGLTGPVGAKGAQGERGAAGANGFNGAAGALGPAGPAGPAGKEGPPGKIEIVTCRKVGKKQKCTTKTVSGTVSFTASSARATLSRHSVVYAAGTARDAHGNMSLRLISVRKLKPGRYTLTLISGTGRHETIRSAEVTLS